MASAQVILSNFYPRPLRRGRPQRSDKPQQTRDFYPRPLRRGRPTPPQEFDLPLAFLSTPSSQRATNSTHPASVTWNHFYPRPLRRGRPYDRRGNRHMGEISIHALFAEGDPTLGEAVNDAVEFLSTPSSQRATSTNPGGVGHVWVFLSTPSSQRATTSSGRCWTIPRISIHALFAEGDMWWWMASRMLTYFYPRPLRRGRPGDKQAKEARQIFLSTPSSQRATAQFSFLRARLRFLSTPSSQRATPQAPGDLMISEFLSTPSSQRATCDRFRAIKQELAFLSTPSSQRATPSAQTRKQGALRFLSTPSSQRATCM